MGKNESACADVCGWSFLTNSLMFMMWFLKPLCYHLLAVFRVELSAHSEDLHNTENGHISTQNSEICRLSVSMRVTI